MSTDNGIRKKLFGQVGTIRDADGNYEPSIPELQKPLQGKSTILRLFCRQCGTLLEITEREAKILALLDETELPENHGEYYFDVSPCRLCKKNRIGQIVRLLPIPRG